MNADRYQLLDTCSALLKLVVKDGTGYVCPDQCFIS